MNLFSACYQLLIGPLELFFEVLFSLASTVTHDPGLSIIALSLAMNVLVLPLYKRADAMQEDARLTQLRLKKWTDHIKKTFKGDERFMMLQTYYRQNGYKPTDALKGSVSLLLEIPFFMAAYQFLSHLELLKGASFGPIQDLGAPDGLLVLGGFAINLLPILMTGINLVSSAIYTKGLSASSKLQLYGMAAIFLVLLYQSPAGLVFYWTLNNLFSLCKNIFYKLKNPQRVLAVLVSAGSALGLVFVLAVRPMPTARMQIFVVAFLLLCQLPLLYQLVGSRFGSPRPVVVEKREKRAFFGVCLYLVVLTGLFIPSQVLAASPEEFLDPVTGISPLAYAGRSALLAAGTFGVWLGIFYLLASPLGQRLMGLGAFAAAGVGTMDHLFFGRSYGTLTENLKYTQLPQFLLKDQLVNLLAAALLAAALALLWQKRAALGGTVCLAAALAAGGMAGVNLAGVNQAAAAKGEQLSSAQLGEARIPLSKTGKNVIVLMLDRAVSDYLPIILAEKPQLQKQFDGFVYYPNTISFGPSTNMALPAVLGGYEYTPQRLNQRKEEPLEQKHNEALKVLPVAFAQQGYQVTVCDPTYAGYDWVPDLSIYDDYPEISTFLTKGRFNQSNREVALAARETRSRNFFCYSLFKTAPVLLQPVLYSSGTYNGVNGPAEQFQQGMSQAEGLRDLFLDAYMVLDSLGRITEITDNDKGTFLMMTNDTTHDPMLLQAPDYEPLPQIDNSEYDAAHADRFGQLRMETPEQMAHYHANMAALLQLGRWFDQLRQLGVYDNTRVILVADHGFRLGQNPQLLRGTGAGEDGMSFHPLFMVKDFDSTGFATDDRFMTNADTAALAVEGLWADPANPFTGQPLDSHWKAGPQMVFYSDHFDVLENNGSTFLPGRWFRVEQNIFEKENWTEISEEEAAAG